MTTKTITTYSAGGYSLSSSYSELDITAAGGFGGGVYSANFATLSNAGAIRSTTTIGAQIGVLFGPSSGGGVVINQAGGYIGSAHYGVFSDSTLTLSNYGTVHGSSTVVEANAGGSIINGSVAHHYTTMSGGQIRLLNAASTITNLGTIDAFVFMNKGGTIINGAALDTAALMLSGGGIYIAGAPGTIGNFATIEAYGATSNGVNLGAGGLVTNGSVSDTAAKITAFTAVLLSASGTVTNFGLIDGVGSAHAGNGVDLGAGGVITNGTGLDQGALIEGYSGIYIGGAAGTVTNWGTIIGQGAAQTEHGVYLKSGGLVANGGGGDRAATIEGGDGVATGGGAATVKNFGTILATAAAGVGVTMSAGALTNGSPNNAHALIEGYTGALLAGAATSSNFGTISGLGDAGGFGVSLGGSESLINGAVGHGKATIDGYTGVSATGTANTVTNFGDIYGAGGTALTFASSLDTLVVEVGCSFEGAVLGGGGTLVLDSGTGTLTGLLSSGGNVTVSGSMATTTFQAFATVEIGAAATFSTSGAVSLAAGQTVIDAGSLTLGGGKSGVANGGLIEVTGGTLTVNGAVAGKGSATIAGGTLDFTSSFNQAVAFSGTNGVLELAQSQSYTAAITGFSKTGGTSLDLVDIGFVSSGEATYSGTTKSGILTVTDGTHTAHIALKGNYTTATFVASSDGHGGTTVVDPTKAASPVALPVGQSPTHQFIAAMAGMGAVGTGLEAIAAHAVGASPMLLAPRSQLA